MEGDAMEGGTTQLTPAMGHLQPIVNVFSVICGIILVLAASVALRSRSARAPRPSEPTTPPTSNETLSLPAWVWRVPFAVTGSTFVICAGLPLVYPVFFFRYAPVTLLFFMIPGFTALGFVIYGCRRVAISEAEALEPSESASPLFYAFIVPNYKEEEEVLNATLAHLAAHPYAARQFIVVMAMEAREPGAQLKAERLCAAWGEHFYEMSYSLHQIDATECPGKASNATAAGKSLSQLCRRLRLPPSLVNVTVMDADTQISHRFHLRLDRMLAASHAAGDAESVTKRIFTPYMSFTNIDDPSISVVVVVMDLVWCFTQMYFLSRPTPIRFATSTYSLSLELLEATGYWEVGDAGIGEDTHETLKVFFATEGAVRTVPIFETFHCQCLQGEGMVHATIARYTQAARHALGHLDMGYVLHKGWTVVDMPWRLRLFAIMATFEQGEFWVIAIMIGWGTSLSMAVIALAQQTNPWVCDAGGAVELLLCYRDVDRGIDPLLYWVAVGATTGFTINALGNFVCCEWISAHHVESRTPRQRLRALLKWATAPLMFVLLFLVPALTSHWKLLRQEKLTYAVAPKAAISRTASTASELSTKNGMSRNASAADLGGKSGMSSRNASVPPSLELSARNGGAGACKNGSGSHGSTELL